jgi:hypothetical protein
MIFKLEKPLKYFPTWNGDSGEITVSFLTVKKVVVDILLQNISVLFFEAPSPLIIFEKEGYDLCLSSEKIRIKIDKMIKGDAAGLLKIIFELEDLDKLRQENLLSSLKVTELKVFESRREQVLSENLKHLVEDSDKDEYTTEKMRKRRLNICSGCSFFDTDALAGTGSCNKCKCPIQYKVKIASSRCPVGKWGAV